MGGELQTRLQPVLQAPAPSNGNADKLIGLATDAARSVNAVGAKIAIANSDIRSILSRLEI
jgi:hypothetical protein